MNFACGGGSSSVFRKRVERLLGQHVDLVDDVDLVARRDRRIADAVDDLANVVDAGMRGGVHLEHVHVPRFHDGLAMDAQARHVDRRGAGAVGHLVIEARARMRAVVVLPTPRTPVSIQACGMRPVSNAFDRVRTIASWPIRSSNVRGRYLRARTR